MNSVELEQLKKKVRKGLTEKRYEKVMDAVTKAAKD